MGGALKDFIATQADPAHCKSASFAAAGPSASHTGLIAAPINMGPRGFTDVQKAQIAKRLAAKVRAQIVKG